MRLNLKRALKFWTVGASGAVIQSVVFYVLTRSLGVPDFVNLFGVIVELQDKTGVHLEVRAVAA